MDATAYNRRSHRDLPRDVECVVSALLGDLVGDCHGVIDRHHTDPDDPDSATLPVCKRHHPRLQALVRLIVKPKLRRRCPHPPGSHRYAHAREECERRLNAA
jgi:hypothetical protein